MESVIRLKNEELLFYAACVCNCWSICLCVCVCLDGRAFGAAGAAGAAGGMRTGGSWRCQLSRTMRLVLRWCRPHGAAHGGGREGRVSRLWSYTKVMLKSLYYNSLSDSDTLFDCVFEPIYWIVDNITRWFGVVFVSLVVLLTSSVVIIIYLFVIPIIVRTYPVYLSCWHLLCGHWLLLMLVFHYYKATTTAAGHPPKEKIHVPAVSMCKKCITPKPARTHHCSICSTCVLKMDHHCPWLNNCVGHFNHRYFYCFCLYMTLGCVYCSVSSWDMFVEAYDAVESYYQTTTPEFTLMDTTGHKCIIFLWVLTSSVAVALGGLTLWHSILITRGETSVERHINKSENRRLKERGKVFRNPYHHGKLNNWKLLFGVEKRSHWLTRVLLPSSHLPKGDGIVWEWIYTRRDPMAI